MPFDPDFSALARTSGLVRLISGMKGECDGVLKSEFGLCKVCSAAE